MMKFSKKSRMYVSVLLSLFLAVIEGTGITWTSPMLNKLNSIEDNPLGRIITSDEGSLLVALQVLGSCFGSLFIMSIAHKMGRKPLLTMIGIPALLHFITFAFSHDIRLYYFARIASGFVAAATNILVPMYICEIADAKLRGQLAAGIIISMNLGILITFCMGPFVSFFWYHICLSLMPITFMILFYAFALESPYYVLQTNPLGAENILKELRGVDNVTETMNEMKRCSDETSEDNFLAQIKLRSTRKALLTGLGLITFLECSGSSVIISYSQFIFDSAGSAWSGEVDNIIVGVIELIVSLFSSSVMDKYGRKRLMSLSSTGVGISIGLLSVYFIVDDNGADVKSFGWLPLACLLGFTCSYNIGLGPLYKTVLGELFSLKAKNAALSLCSLWMSVLGFILKLIFQRLGQSIGLGGTFSFYSVMALCGAIFIVTFIIETRGKTLEEIQDDLNTVKINE